MTFDEPGVLSDVGGSTSAIGVSALSTFILVNLRHNGNKMVLFLSSCLDNQLASMHNTAMPLLRVTACYSMARCISACARGEGTPSLAN